jgi:hypothetical protein
MAPLASSIGSPSEALIVRLREPEPIDSTERNREHFYRELLEARPAEVARQAAPMTSLYRPNTRQAAMPGMPLARRGLENH